MTMMMMTTAPPLKYYNQSTIVCQVDAACYVEGGTEGVKSEGDGSAGGGCNSDIDEADSLCPIIVDEHYTKLLNLMCE